MKAVICINFMPRGIYKRTKTRTWRLTYEQKRKHAMFGDNNPSKRLDVKEKMSKAKLGKGLPKDIKRKHNCIRMKTYHDIQNGKIKRECCYICGIKKTQVHHIDYNDRKHIIFLCKKHHRKLHINMGTYKWYKNFSLNQY